MNSLNLINTTIKAIQELSQKNKALRNENMKLKEKVDEHEKVINFFMQKFNLKDELKKYMKGED